MSTEQTTSPGTLDLTLAPAELQALTALAECLDMSPKQVLRQALRMYQMDHHKRQQGLRPVYVDANSQLEQPLYPLMNPSLVPKG